MRRIVVGLSLGAGAGVIDVTPMIAQKLTWDANLSAFTMWVVVGFFLSTSRLAIPAVAHGLLTALLCLLPTAILIGHTTPVALIPIGGMTVILGSLLGWAVRKWAR